ncbi:ABC transporter substrate-binding protein [Candidatus Bipolaricaulota bacterium]|nr:ABC transporter substrate-binding protein [Candidatus Bipolaricaulota bacterium]
MKNYKIGLIALLGVLLVGGVVIGKELHVGIGTEPWDLDPAIRTDTASGYLIENIYDPIIELDRNREVTTKFALTREYDWKNNKKTIVLHLREGVKFHDGTDFTAADVKYNINWQLNPDNNAPNAGLLGPIENVEVVDEYTLRVDFEKPFPQALMRWSRALDGIVPEGGHGNRSKEKGVAGFAGTQLSRNPVGTGPFEFVDWVSGSHITLKKFDDYWAEGVPAVDKVVFDIIPDQSALEAALISGSVDIIDKLPHKDFATIKRMPNIETEKMLGTLTEVAYLNLGAPPFGITEEQVGDQEAVERALNMRKFLYHAINREEIKEQLFYGMAEIQHGPWYPNSDWTSPKLKKAGRPYNPELARQHLEKAGYDKDEEIRIMATKAQWFVDMATIIQEQLRQFGVSVEVIPVDKATLFDRLYETFDWEIAIEDWGLNDFTPSSWLWSGYYRNNHNHNHWHHESPDLADHLHETVPGHEKFQEMYDKAVVEPDTQKRKELIWEMEEMVTDKVIQVDMMYLYNIYAWRSTVKGFGDGLTPMGNLNLAYITEFTGN